MSTSTSPEMASSALDSIPGSAPSTQPSQAALPSPPSLLPTSHDVKPPASPEKTLSRPQDSVFFFDPTSEKAAKLSADLITLIPDEPSLVTTTLEQATHVLLARPSTYADEVLQARARSPPPLSSSSSSRPQQLLTLDWVEESIRLKEWQPEESYVYVSIPAKEGKGREGRVSRRSAGGSSVYESHLPKCKVSKPKEKKETTKASKKKAVPAAYSVQESTDLRRFLRESQTIADACEKMAAAHPRRTAGTVRVYYSKNKDEFEDELGSEAPVHSWVWTPDEHVLLVKVLAGPVGSLNRGFKAFSEQHPKRSVIAAAKYYQNNRIRLELEIEALQKDPSSWSSGSKPTNGSPGSPSSSESSTMEWGEQEEIEIVQSEPKRRKKPAPSIPYTEEETADLQRILRESETLKEAAEKMEKAHPRRTAVSIGMYCYRHKETFATDFKPRPPSIPWTKQEEQDLLRTFATSTETLLMQCQAVHDMHPHRTPLSVSAYWFKHRDRLSPLVDAIKQTLPPPPPPPPSPAPTTSNDAPSFASILGSINSLLQNNPPAPSPSSSSKRASEEPSAPTPPKRGRLNASPPPEVILASSSTSSGSMLGLLALPRLAPPKPPPSKPQPKPRKSNPTTTKIKVEEQEVVASPVVVASKPTPPGRIILRLPPSSNLSSSTTGKPSPAKKLKLEPSSSLPPPPLPAPIVAPTIPKFSLPRLSLSARPSVPKVPVLASTNPEAQHPTSDTPVLPVSQEEVPAPGAEEEVGGAKGTRRSSRRR